MLKKITVMAVASCLLALGCKSKQSLPQPTFHGIYFGNPGDKNDIESITFRDVSAGLLARKALECRIPLVSDVHGQFVVGLSPISIDEPLARGLPVFCQTSTGTRAFLIASTGFQYPVIRAEWSLDAQSPSIHLICLFVDKSGGKPYLADCFVDLSGKEIVSLLPADQRHWMLRLFIENWPTGEAK